ncbi:MAG: hypothetical protein JWO52_4310 [Gammaproteobacteria bacterium]|jgi:hypothetical protein|nr:hypothetical protein [Gammaproteobacteria bacterium]
MRRAPGRSLDDRGPVSDANIADTLVAIEVGDRLTATPTARVETAATA